MSITTYDELKTAVARWLKRDDLTAYIPDYIAFGERRLWYGDNGQFPSDPLRLEEMQTTASGSISAGLLAFPLDSDGKRNLLEVVRFSVSSGGSTWPLTYLSPQQFTEYEDKTGDPKYYTSYASFFRLAPLGSVSYDLAYYAVPDALSASNTTELVLTKHPELYLYAACIEGAIDMQNDSLAARMASSLRGKINAVNTVSTSKQPGGSLCVQVGR